MDLKAFYEKTGGNYESAMGTFRTEERLESYLRRYFDDPNYQRLCRAADQDDINEAFEAVHAMKGTTGMFFLTPMYNAIVELVEQLRPQTEPVREDLLRKVKEERAKLEQVFQELE